VEGQGQLLKAGLTKCSVRKFARVAREDAEVLVGWVVLVELVHPNLVGLHQIAPEEPSSLAGERKGR
jgi:hypothetical protein